jgi:hypothetical protein
VAAAAISAAEAGRRLGCPTTWPIHAMKSASTAKALEQLSADEVDATVRAHRSS